MLWALKAEISQKENYLFRALANIIQIFQH